MWVITDDGNRTPEGSCHGHCQAGTSQDFGTIIVAFDDLKHRIGEVGESQSRNTQMFHLSQ